MSEINPIPLPEWQVNAAARLRRVGMPVLRIADILHLPLSRVEAILGEAAQAEERPAFTTHNIHQAHRLYRVGVSTDRIAAVLQIEESRIRNLLGIDAASIFRTQSHDKTLLPQPQVSKP